MTQKTKLEIIGPYTPEHEGSFCTRDGRPVRIICTDKRGERPIVYLIGGTRGEAVYFAHEDGSSVFNHDSDIDIMNAREVPVAREFWVNEYENVSENAFGAPHNSYNVAMEIADGRSDYIRTIHVREVLPGEGA